MSNRYSNATEQEIVREAWMVQDACNLSGVLYSFADMVCRLRELGVNTYDRQGIRHPAIVAMLDKVCDLVGRPTHEQVMAAFDVCAKEGMKNE